MTDPLSIAGFLWTAGTTIISVAASVWAALKVMENRVKRLEADIIKLNEEHDELEKEVLARLRNIELALAEMKVLLGANQQHWSITKES